MKNMKGFIITWFDWEVLRHSRRCSRNILVLFYNIVDLLHLYRRVLDRGYYGFNFLLFLLSYEKDKLCDMRDYFAKLFCRDNSLNYIWYHVGLTPQSNNDSTWSRLINNMKPPHIWLD
jgi:hypothetical protein